MSLAAHLTLLVVAAVVITTILVVGTLLAADIIQLGRRDESPAPEAEGSAPEGAPRPSLRWAPRWPPGRGSATPADTRPGTRLDHGLSTGPPHRAPAESAT